MLYKEYPPGPELEPYVKCFWILEHDYSKAPMKGGERLWPDGYYELVFSYGCPYFQKFHGSAAPLSACFLIGQFDTELLLDSMGKTGLFAIRFHAWGLYPLLKTPMSSFNNRIVALETIFGNEILHLPQDQEKKEASVSMLKEFVLSRLAPPDEESAIVRTLGQLIAQRHGMVRISDLMQRFDPPARKIQRLFLEHTGLSAKRFAKIIRFREAKRSIERDPNINLAELTYACGYSDQSHFTRNFKQLYGITPSEHKKRVLYLAAFYKAGKALEQPHQRRSAR